LSRRHDRDRADALQGLSSFVRYSPDPPAAPAEGPNLILSNLTSRL